MSVCEYLKMLQCITLCVVLFVTGSIANVVPFIKPCPQTDYTCIVNSAKIALPEFSPGIPELGIPATDPLVVPDVETNIDGFYMNVRNMVVRGLGKCKFNKIERDVEKSTGHLDITCPIECVGNYTFDGTLLLVPISGNGPFRIKGDKMRITVTIKMKQNTKADKKYYKITGFDYTYEPLSKFELKFENLFNGDKVKAEPVEKIFEQNDKEIMLGIGKPVLKQIFTGAVGNVGKLLQSIPVEEIEIA